MDGIHFCIRTLTWFTRTANILSPYTVIVRYQILGGDGSGGIDIVVDAT